jgi:hypothetical protein
MGVNVASAALLIGLVTGAASHPPAPPSDADAPFIETFHRNTKTLIYIAATHHSPQLFPNAMADPVFKTIAQVFSATPPDALIVEGVGPSDMAGFLNFSKECAASNYDVRGNACDEPEFAAYSAVQIGAPVFTGEPSGPVLLSYFKAKGYSTEDVLAYYIMINIPFQNRHAPIAENAFPEFVDRIVANENHYFGTSVRFTASDFAAWYAKRMQAPREYLKLTNEDTSPAPAGEAPKSSLHALSRTFDEVRDENVVRTIKSAFEKYNRVLTVYGASHFDFEWKELIQFLGVPKRTKPF